MSRSVLASYSRVITAHWFDFWGLQNITAKLCYYNFAAKFYFVLISQIYTSNQKWQKKSYIALYKFAIYCNSGPAPCKRDDL